MLAFARLFLSTSGTGALNFWSVQHQQQLVADEHDHTGPYRLQSVLTLTPTAYGFGASDAMNPDGTQARRMQVSARFVF